jgi:hypothetical protein
MSGVNSCKFFLKPLEDSDSFKKYRSTAPQSIKSEHRTINHDVLREVERIKEIKAKMTDVEKLNYELQEEILEALLILIRQLGRNASVAPNASTAVSVASFIPTSNNIIESLEED